MESTRAAAGKRADARRNAAAILDAAADCLAGDPDASVGEIAAAAGVGRATLYGHFPSRAELVEAAFARIVEHAERSLSALDLTGDPRDALARLVAASWQLVARSAALLTAAQHELPAAAVRAHHREPLDRVRALIARGRAAGVFRDDLPEPWLVAVFYHTVHGAAAELAAGRLAAHDAARVITATLHGAYAPPGGAGPHRG